MIARHGRHQPRNVYLQPGPTPSDSDEFVARFDNYNRATQYVWLYNRHLAATTEPARGDIP